MRDSVDRARKLENEEAAHAALRAAEQSGVTYMSRAIVAVTVAKHWTAMVDSFAESTGTTTRGVLDP